MEFERKAIKYQEEYHGMLKKYQLLLMRESTVRTFKIKTIFFYQILKHFSLLETRSNSRINAS